jgi:hypothetical protein
MAEMSDYQEALAEADKRIEELESALAKEKESHKASLKGDASSIAAKDKLIAELTYALSVQPEGREPITATPERLSSLEHSELKPDERSNRSVGEESGGSRKVRGRNQVLASGAERGAHDAGEETGRVVDSGPQAEMDAARYRFVCAHNPPGLRAALTDIANCKEDIDGIVDKAMREAL